MGKLELDSELIYRRPLRTSSTSLCRGSPLDKPEHVFWPSVDPFRQAERVHEIRATSHRDISTGVSRDVLQHRASQSLSSYSSVHP